MAIGIRAIKAVAHNARAVHAQQTPIRSHRAKSLVRQWDGPADLVSALVMNRDLVPGGPAS